MFNFGSVLQTFSNKGNIIEIQTVKESYLYFIGKTYKVCEIKYPKITTTVNQTYVDFKELIINKSDYSDFEGFVYLFNVINKEDIYKNFKQEDVFINPTQIVSIKLFNANSIQLSLNLGYEEFFKKTYSMFVSEKEKNKIIEDINLAYQKTLNNPINKMDYEKIVNMYPLYNDNLNENTLDDNIL